MNLSFTFVRSLREGANHTIYGNTQTGRRCACPSMLKKTGSALYFEAANGGPISWFAGGVVRASAPPHRFYWPVLLLNCDEATV
jgi:hypothetical protein